MWHYIGYIQIPKEWTQIDQINERKAEYKERKAAPVTEEIDDVGTNDADNQDDHIFYDNERFDAESDSRSDDEVFVDQSKF